MAPPLIAPLDATQDKFLRQVRDGIARHQSDAANHEKILRNLQLKVTGSPSMTGLTSMLDLYVELIQDFVDKHVGKGVTYIFPPSSCAQLYAHYMKVSPTPQSPTSSVTAEDFSQFDSILFVVRRDIGFLVLNIRPGAKRIDCRDNGLPIDDNDAIVLHNWMRDLSPSTTHDVFAWEHFFIDPLLLARQAAISALVVRLLAFGIIQIPTAKGLIEAEQTQRDCDFRKRLALDLIVRYINPSPVEFYEAVWRFEFIDKPES